MATVTISEAKANFSALVKQVQRGEAVTIAAGQKKKPVARLMPIEPVKRKRLGVIETPGFVLDPRFFEPLPEEELRLWNGDGE